MLFTALMCATCGPPVGAFLVRRVPQPGPRSPHPQILEMVDGFDRVVLEKGIAARIRSPVPVAFRQVWLCLRPCGPLQRCSLPGPLHGGCVPPLLCQWAISWQRVPGFSEETHMSSLNPGKPELTLKNEAQGARQTNREPSRLYIHRSLDCGFFHLFWSVKC